MDIICGTSKRKDKFLRLYQEYESAVDAVNEDNHELRQLTTEYYIKELVKVIQKVKLQHYNM